LLDPGKTSRLPESSFYSIPDHRTTYRLAHRKAESAYVQAVGTRPEHQEPTGPASPLASSRGKVR